MCGISNKWFGIEEIFGRPSDLGHWDCKTVGHFTNNLRDLLCISLSASVTPFRRIRPAQSG